MALLSTYFKTHLKLCISSVNREIGLFRDLKAIPYEDLDKRYDDRYSKYTYHRSLSYLFIQ